MAEVRDRTFTDNAEVETDGTRFVGCRFDSATLRYSGGEHPLFENCSFGDIGWYFAGPALRTIQLLQLLNSGSGSEFVKGLFAPDNYIEE